jgi:uroporphyrin-III C-methyltransferase/precorrin-2 dehydrogenase/sirohydrochlorin ferrochelatase
MSDAYLAGLYLSGRRVLVAGGGGVAQRRLPALVRSGADILLVAPEATPTVKSLVTSAGIRWQRRTYRPQDLDGAWYALALTGDPQVNDRIAADAETARIFCVRADDASLGSAVTPAIASDGPVTVGVLGGGDPRRAVAVRDGVLAAMREGRLDVLAHRRLPGTGLPGVAIVGGGPGDPGLITVRGRRLLSHADVVVADRWVPAGVLSDLGPGTEVVDITTLTRGQPIPQKAVNDVLVRHALAGRFVVRLKGGDPYVFGRGSEEVAACAEAGVPVTVVPGVSSAIAVPELAGIPLANRWVSHEIVIVTGHLPPDHPDSLVNWGALAAMEGTLVLLMAIDNLPAISAALLAGGRIRTTPAAAIEKGTLPGERIVDGTLATIADTVRSAGVTSPAVVVIGDAVAARTPPEAKRETPPT